MLQAILQDADGNTITPLSGDLGDWYNPIDIAKSGYSKAKSATQSAGRAITEAADKTWDVMKDATAWTAQKHCEVAQNNWVRAGAAATATVPTGYTQIIGGAVLATGAACDLYEARKAQNGAPPIPGSYGFAPPLDPLPPPPAPGQQPALLTPQQQGSLPPNVIFAYDSKAQAYRVAQELSGLYGAGGLGKATEIALTTTKPAQGQQVSLDEYDKETGRKKAWYANPWVWGGVGAAALIAGGAVMLSRR